MEPPAAVSRSVLEAAVTMIMPSVSVPTLATYLVPVVASQPQLFAPIVAPAEAVW